MRRAHLPFEVAIQALGSLGLILAAIAALMAVVLGLVALGPDNAMLRSQFTQGAVVAVVIGLVSGGFGFGLSRLQPWARIASVALAMIILTGLVAFGVLARRDPAMIVTTARWVPLSLLAAIAMGVLFLLASQRGQTVFTPTYQEARQRSTSPTVRISPIVLLGLIVVVLLIAGGSYVRLVKPVF